MIGLGFHLSDYVFRIAEDDSPPALPEKTRSKGSRRERHPSQYDNVPDDGTVVTQVVTSESHAVTSVTRTTVCGDEVDSRQVTQEASSAAQIASISNHKGNGGNSIKGPAGTCTYFAF